MHFSDQTMWILFGGVVLVMLVLDLGVFHRKAHVVKIREALIWTVIWVLVALAFMGFVYYSRGSADALDYLTGYLIEKALSVDNLFVFLMVFTHFRVPSEHQHKILFWGIIGALIMRAVFIGLGVVLITKFHFVIYVFGALLIYSGIKMAFTKEDEEVDFEKNFILKICRKLFPIANHYEGGKFFSNEGGKRHATLLFVVLLIIETTDVLFAVDSVPAVLAISQDPLIVYSSNVFAILGLRSLFFALAGLLDLFHYLNYGLCVILIFVGLKMIASGFFHVPTAISLSIIVLIIGSSVAASVFFPKKHEA